MANTIAVTSPYSGELIKELSLQDEENVFRVLDKSYNLFLNKDTWFSKVKRIEIFKKVIRKMDANKEHLAELATREGGKPLQDSLVEVNRAIEGVEAAVHVLSRESGEMIPMGITPSSENRLAYTIKEPVGVVIAVSAFNHPLNLIIHQVIPAVAVGAPVIIKPSLATPLSCLNFVDLLYESGLPEDWCRAIICDHKTTKKLIRDPRIRFLSFVGSARVGWYLKSILPPGADCVLEHGGAAPVIVEKDADFNVMIPALLKGGFYHSGQVCVSVQRIYVHDAIVDYFIKIMVDSVNGLVIGDPLDKGTDVGPLIAPSEVDRIEKWVDNVRKAGAKILCGGKRINEFFFEPTIVLDPPAKCELSTDEVFGPVVVVYPYSDRIEAIKKANTLPFSFQASVFTQDLDIAFDTVSKLKADAVMVNDHTAFRVDWMPFGGSEHSGLGRGGIPYTMEEFSKDKLVVIKSQCIK